MYVHALLVLWQAESVHAHNEQGVSAALYHIIPPYLTPEGRKLSKRCLIFALHHHVCVFTALPLSGASLTGLRPWGFSTACIMLLSLLASVQKLKI